MSSMPSARQVPFRHSEPLAQRQRLALRDLVEEIGARNIDEADARPDELERPGIRKPAGGRARDVDDGPDARVRELLGRDAIEVDVVDDREVARLEPLDEVLGPASQPGDADDVGHRRGSEVIAARNSSPPSMRSSSA